MDIELNSWILIENDDFSSAIGQVTNISESRSELTVTVQPTGEKAIINQLDKVKPLFKRDADVAIDKMNFPNMINLSELNEAAILENLRNRFENGDIYTYTGSILLAINPYENVSCYEANNIRLYQKARIGELPPHIFAIANETFRQMIEHDKNQCVVISGESGAGKTESTKLIVSFLAILSGKHGMIEEKILTSSSILEAFGNAGTVRNSNSSRFGKYIELQFNEQNKVEGAKLHDYLLEKSRIVNQAENEMNYHVFYYLLASSPAEFNLNHEREYFYLKHQSTDLAIKLSANENKDGYGKLVNSMESFGFSSEDIHEIFSILAAILHIGNIIFCADEDEDESTGGEYQQIIVKDKFSIETAAKLLQVDVVTLEEALTKRKSVTRGETFITPLSALQSNNNRDALAKALYEWTFKWIVHFLDSKMYSDNKATRTIGVLDIFGFENFPCNSFEQLCINYANERLQYFFNDNIFRLEQEEYRLEDISWSDIAFKDNQGCLDLISKKPFGILHLLNEEINFPKSSDKTFLEKLITNQDGHPNLVKSKQITKLFTISHYAGKVNYDVEGFLEKNRDSLLADICSTLESSNSDFICKILDESKKESLDRRQKYEKNIGTLSNAKSNTNKQLTLTSPKKNSSTQSVGTKFDESLQQLIANLSVCEVFFVRCFKPNSLKKPKLFDPCLVFTQLKYSGVLETVKIRKSGYSIRFAIDEFIMKYQPIILNSTHSNRNGNLPIQIMEYAISQSQALLSLSEGSSKCYQLGKSKVFLKDSLKFELDRILNRVQGNKAITLQKIVRGHLARKTFELLRQATIFIQSLWKGNISRRTFEKSKNSIVFIQKCIRRYTVKAYYRRMIQELKLVQLIFKSMACFIKANQVIKKTENMATVIINNCNGNDDQASKNMKSSLKKKSNKPKSMSSKTKSFADTQPYKKFALAFLRSPDNFFMEASEDVEILLNNVPDNLLNLIVEACNLIKSFINTTNISEKESIAYALVKIACEIPILKDEFLIQICKVLLNGTDTRKAEILAWKLLSICLCSFSPSSNLIPFMKVFIESCPQGNLQSFLLNRTLRAENIPRSLLPTILEIQHVISEEATMVLSVNFVNGNSVELEVDSFTTVSDIISVLLNDISVKSKNGYSITAISPLKSNFMNESSRIMDTYSSFYGGSSCLPSSASFLQLDTKLYLQKCFIDLDEVIDDSNEALFILKLIEWRVNHFTWLFSGKDAEFILSEIHSCFNADAKNSCSAVSLVNELITHPLVFGIVFSNVILGENSFNETSLRAGNEIILSVDYCGLHLLTVESKMIIRSFLYDSIASCLVQIEDVLALAFQDGEKLLLHAKDSNRIQALYAKLTEQLRKVGKWCLTLDDYGQPSMNDGLPLLNFRKGAILEILERDEESGLFLGRNASAGGQTGWFPCDYVSVFLAKPAKTTIFNKLAMLPVPVLPPVEQLPQTNSKPQELSYCNEDKSIAKDNHKPLLVSETTALQEERTPIIQNYKDFLINDWASSNFRILASNNNTLLSKSHLMLSKHSTLSKMVLFSSSSQNNSATTDESPPIQYDLNWDKIPIKFSLHKLDLDLSRIATQIFQMILQYMGDYPAKGFHKHEWMSGIVSKGIEHENLRDEIICQLIKQVTRNTSKKADSVERGWELMYFCLLSFGPSKAFKPYLLNFLHINNNRNDNKSSINEFCKKCLEAIEERGENTAITTATRTLPPSVSESICIMECKPIFIPIHFNDGSIKKFEANPFLKVKDMLKKIMSKMNIGITLEYALSYELNGEDKFMNENDLLMDSIAKYYYNCNSSSSSSNAISSSPFKSTNYNNINSMNCFDNLKIYLTKVVWYENEAESENDELVRIMYHQLRFSMYNAMSADFFIDNMEEFIALEMCAGGLTTVDFIAAIERCLPKHLKNAKGVETKLQSKDTKSTIVSLHESYQVNDEISIYSAQRKILLLLLKARLFGCFIYKLMKPKLTGLNLVASSFSCASSSDIATTSVVMLGIGYDGIKIIDAEALCIVVIIPMERVLSWRFTSEHISIQLGGLRESTAIQIRGNTKMGMEIAHLLSKYTG